MNQKTPYYKREPRRYPCANYHYGKCSYGLRCRNIHTTAIFAEPVEVAGNCILQSI